MFRNLIRSNLTARRIALVAAPLAVLGAVVPTAAAASTFGDARRRAPLRATGGGAATCCLRRRACLPLIRTNGSPRLERRE